MVTSDENANTSTAQLMVEQDFHYNIARETVKGDRFDTYVYIASADNLGTHFASDKTEHTQLYSDGSFLTAPPPIVSVLNVPVHGSSSVRIAFLDPARAKLWLPAKF